MRKEVQRSKCHGCRRMETGTGDQGQAVVMCARPGQPKREITDYVATCKDHISVHMERGSAWYSGA